MSISDRNNVGIIMNFIAYLFAILKSVIYGSTIFFTGSLTESVDVLDILALRFLMSFVVIWLLKLTRIVRIDINIRDIFKKNERTPYIKNLLLAAMFEPVLYMMFETLGISMTTGITTAVILSLTPITSCIIEWVVLKEKSTWLQKLFLASGIFGVIYISANTSTSDGENSIMGIVFLVCALVTGSLFGVFSRKSSSHFAPMEITYVSCLLGTVAFNTVNVIRHIAAGDILHYFDPYFDLNNIIGFIFLAVISTIVATGMNNYALSKIQLSTMSAFGGISTLVTVSVDVIFNGAKLYYFHIIGFAFIIARMIGVSAISIGRDRKARLEIESKIQKAERKQRQKVKRKAITHAR